MRTSAEINNIYAAIIKAQPNFKNAKKDSENPFHKSNYADHESVVDAVREELKVNGLAFVQGCELKDGQWQLVTRLIHTSGQWIETDYPLKPGKEDPQGFAAANTYAKRISLQTILGVVASEEDRDAEDSMDRGSRDRLASKQDVSNIIVKFNGIHVSEGDILKYLNLKNRSEITEENYQTLRAIGTAITVDKKPKEEFFKAAK